MAENVDVSPEILEKLQGNRRASTADSREATRIFAKAVKGGVTLKDANRYARLRGEQTASAVRTLFGSDLPNGQMYYNIADKALRTVLEELSEDVLDVSEAAMGKTNSDAGIGLAVAVPDESEKIQGILDVAASDLWDDVKETVASAAANFSHKCVDDTIRENAERQYEAGLSAKVHRTPAMGACTWCCEVAGTYSYEEVRGAGSDVWRRHANCDCVVEYEPVKGQQQLVSRGTYHNNTKSMSPEERERQAEELQQKEHHPEPLSRIYINHDEQLYKNLLKVVPEPGFEDIAIHGTPDAVIYTSTLGVDAMYNAKEFADMLRSDPNYHGGDIRLLSCNTGQKEGGFADQLAHELGVNVKAPTEVLWTREKDGELFISDSKVLAEMWDDGLDVYSTGTWIVFPKKETYE